MGRAKYPGAGPAVLADPLAAIVDVVAQVEPDLAVPEVVAAVDQVAGAVSTRRRLAQALHADPALLFSGRPAGSPLVEHLIRALQRRGARRVVLPRCGHCGRQKPLPNVDGPVRICDSCAARRRNRAVCAGCGQDAAIRRHDWIGRALCRRCARRDDVDHGAVLVDRIAGLDPAADRHELVELVLRVLPRRWEQRDVADELLAHPARLTGQAAQGTARLHKLVAALVEHGVCGVVAPACPFCQRTVALPKVRDAVRCCRRCYEASRTERCSRCHADRPVASRTQHGGAVCHTCHHNDPANQAPCPGCGRTARLIRHGTQPPRCRRCWRAPTATCSLCGKDKPCYFTNTATPQCEPCSNKLLRSEPCAHCGRTRIVNTRTADGAALCQTCSPRRAECRDCGRTMRVAGILADGPRCKTCYRSHPDNHRPCIQCGTVERLYHWQRCTGCACLHQLHHLLGADDGTIPDRLEPVFTTLARSAPASTLRWLSYAGTQLLGRLRADTRVVSHQLLDQFPRRGVPALRAALVAAGRLEPRDEFLHDLEAWIRCRLTQIADEQDLRLLRSFSTWQLLRRLRQQSQQRHLTFGQAAAARTLLTAAITLLAWLHQHGLRLAEATQAAIDDWQTSVRRPHNARPFLVWAIHNRHCPKLEVGPRRRPMAGQAIQADHRWALARRLLHDISLDPVDRFAGLLLLLYAQPAGRTVTLTTNRIVQRIADRQVQLLLGRSPIDLPPQLAELAVTLVVDRRPGRSALGQAEDHAWLFPGSRPGAHLSSHQLNARLKTLGIDAQPARNTTLLDLAAQLPAAVLSSLLGLGHHRHCLDPPRRPPHRLRRRTGPTPAQRPPAAHSPVRTVNYLRKLASSRW